MAISFPLNGNEAIIGNEWNKISTEATANGYLSPSMESGQFLLHRFHLKMKEKRRRKQIAMFLGD